jgi:hypothetical protein
VLKQVVTMIMAASNLKTSAYFTDELRRFVLSPNSMLFPNGLYPKCYLNPVDSSRARDPLLTQNRLVESCAVLDTRIGSSVIIIGEVAFPPMGYVIYGAPSYQPVSQDFGTLCDLRKFGQYRYRQNSDIFLPVPVRYPFGPVPGYYPDLRKPGYHEYLDDNHVLLATQNG